MVDVSIFSPKKQNRERLMRMQLEYYMDNPLAEHRSLYDYGIKNLLHGYKFNVHTRRSNRKIYRALDKTIQDICPNVGKRDSVDMLVTWIEQAPESDKVNRFFRNLIEELKEVE